MSEFSASVKGLAEFDEDMRRLASTLPDTARLVSTKAATMVVDTARPTVPRRSGRAAGSLQVYATASAATAAGGEGIAYYRWLELGGAAGRNHAVIRPRSDGRYIKPAWERRQDEVQTLLAESLAEACRAAGLEVT